MLSPRRRNLFHPCCLKHSGLWEIYDELLFCFRNTTQYFLQQLYTCFSGVRYTSLNWILAHVYWDKSSNPIKWHSRGITLAQLSCACKCSLCLTTLMLIQGGVSIIPPSTEQHRTAQHRLPGPCIISMESLKREGMAVGSVHFHYIFRTACCVPPPYPAPPLGTVGVLSLFRSTSLFSFKVSGKK